MAIAGIVLLLFSGIGIAFILSREADLSLSRTRAIIELLSFTRNSVGMYSMSASEILQAFGAEKIRKCGYPDENAFPQSFFEMSENCVIPDAECRDTFLNFSRGFGQGYRQQEVQRCEEYIERLRKKESEQASALAAKKKMIFGVSIGATLILLILLL